MKATNTDPKRRVAMMAQHVLEVRNSVRAKAIMTAFKSFLSKDQIEFLKRGGPAHTAITGQDIEAVTDQIDSIVKDLQVKVRERLDATLEKDAIDSFIRDVVEQEFKQRFFLLGR